MIDYFSLRDVDTKFILVLTLNTKIANKICGLKGSENEWNFELDKIKAFIFLLFQ